MQCANNLKQWTLAAHNHHDAKEAFPVGTTQISSLAYNGSLFLLLLPFNEQSALYDAGTQFLAINSTPVDGNDPGASITVSGTVYQNPFHTVIKTLQCPSDPVGTTPMANCHTPLNYVGSCGDWQDAGQDTHRERNSTEPNLPIPNPRGVFDFHYPTDKRPENAKTMAALAHADFVLAFRCASIRAVGVNHRHAIFVRNAGRRKCYARCLQNDNRLFQCLAFLCYRDLDID